VTFLFTDIEGSTRLLRELGDLYPTLLGEHDRLLREAFAAAGGISFGSEGDAQFAAFESAPAALSAAVGAQRALAANEWPGGATVRVRMGLHTGEGTVRDGNYVGLDVHRTARIAAVGHGGQVLLSDATQGLVEHSLPDGVMLRDLGRHRLKDLAEPEHLHETVIAGLPSEFPPLRSLDATPNNLPTQMTSFVGRAREVAEARRLLEGTRLLTLTGPGGTGKTRLSLQVAAEEIAGYSDGVFFVPLGPIEDAAMVAQAIVQALGLRDGADQPPAVRLIEYVRERCLLLLLDNFEQVLGAAGLVGELLKAGKELRVVVTSRATLHLYGEKEYEVPPLGLPDRDTPADPDKLCAFEAISLFVERARAARPDFELTAANAAAVAEICSRLDGLPLAIELAAARIKLLPPAALLARIGKQLDVLDAGSRDLPARQQTLRGAIAWSYDLLDPVTARLFACLSQFVEGANLAEVEAVCGGDGYDVLSGLAELVDQSLIRQEEVEGDARFSMLFVIREFALERLATLDVADRVADLHATTYLALAEALAPGLTGPDQKRLLDRLDRENGNLRAALNHSIEHGDAETALRLGAAMWRFWQMRGLLLEGADWLDRILAMPGLEAYPREHARALEAAGGVAYWRALMPKAEAYYEKCLELCRAIGDRAAIANALYNASFPGLVDKTNIPHARVVLEESLAIYRELDDRKMIGRVLWGLGNALYFAEDNEAARDALVEDVALLQTMADPFSLAWAQHTLGLVYNRLGQTESHSEPLWREALTHFASVGDLSGITILVGDFYLLALAQGDPLRAVRLDAASMKLAETGGAMLGSLIAGLERGHPDASSLNPDAVRAAIEEGKAMSPQEAVAYALSPGEIAAGARQATR
jgi:predicted ATPase/class 3 adenylate cyclase